MAFILKSQTASSSTRKLYRDALVNEATLFSFDCKNTHCWNTPTTTPVNAKGLLDLSPNSEPMEFNGTGFGDTSSTEGVLFDQGASSAILIGSAGSLDLEPDNVSGFYTVLWLAFASGYTSGPYSGIADHSSGTVNAAQWGLDTGVSGTSLRCVLGRDSGLLQAGGTGDDIPVDEVFQFAFGYETIGGNNVLTKYLNGVAVGTDSGADSPIKSMTGQKVSLGEAGSGTDQGFRLYRAFQEVTSVSSGGAAASGEDIATRIALDFSINKDRFTF